jgi:hypothetical protein
MAKNEALSLLIDFSRLEDRVLDLPRRGMTPVWVLDRLDALVERLELLQARRPSDLRN